MGSEIAFFDGRQESTAGARDLHSVGYRYPCKGADISRESRRKNRIRAVFVSDCKIKIYIRTRI
jgi:hypothetical protein